MKRFVHRSTASGLPANSIAGMERALALGFDGIELDIQASADDVLYATHDRFVMVGGKKRHLAEVDSAVIAVEGESQPFRLESFLIKLRDSNVDVILDLKSSNAAPLVAALLQDESLRHRTMVVSFSPRDLRSVLDINPHAKIGLVVGWSREAGNVVGFANTVKAILAPLRTAESIGAGTILVTLWRTTPNLVRAARKRGVRVLTWSPRLLTEIPKSLDVDGVILDVT